METLQALIQESEAFDLEKIDYAGDAGAFVFEGRDLCAPSLASGFFGSDVLTAPMCLTEHALAQLRLMLGALAIGPNKTLRREDWDAIRRDFPDLFAQMFNHYLAQYQARGEAQARRTSGLLVRTYRDEVRAVVSERYQVVDNTTLLQVVEDVIQEDQQVLADLHIERSFVSTDSMSVRVVVMHDPERRYGAGFHIGNSEIGGGSVIVNPLIWCVICSNGLVGLHEDAGVRMTHARSASAILANVKIAVAEALPIAVESLERVYEAEAKRLPSLLAIVQGLAEEQGWGEPVVNSVVEGTENQATHMGLVNGITYAAHTAQTNPSDQLTMEQLGWRVLHTPVERLHRQYATIALS